MQPVYFPKLFIEEVDGGYIAVVWAMAGQGRPYKCPEYITQKIRYINIIFDMVQIPLLRKVKWKRNL